MTDLSVEETRTETAMDDFVTRVDRDCAVNAMYLVGGYEMCRRLLTSPRFNRPQRELIEEQALDLKERAEDQGANFAEITEDIRRQRDESRERERTLEDVLTVIAGDYGCGLIEPPDQSLPPEGDPCHERYPDDPEKWCVSCIASMALLGLAASPGEPEGQQDPGAPLFSTPKLDFSLRAEATQPDHGPGEPSELEVILELLEERHNAPDWDEDVSSRVEALLREHGRRVGESNG